MVVLPSPRSPRRFVCSEVEEFEAMLRLVGFDLELVQIRPGPFRAEGLVLALEHLQVVQVRLQRSVLAIGAKPRRCFAFALSLTPLVPGPVGLQAHGHELPEQALYGLDPHREVHLVTPEPYRLAMLRVEQSRLLELGERLGCPELERPLRQHNWLALDSEPLAALRAFLQQLFLLADQQPQVFTSLEQQRRLAADLLPLVLQALVDGLDRGVGRPREPARIDLVKLVENWARQNPTEPITLEELCSVVYASRRSLMRGFREHLGMGPMAYLKVRRLHGVHAQLLQQELGSVRVQDLAARWGFHNAGHFARDYRQLFGERPHETLRRFSRAERS